MNREHTTPGQVVQDSRDHKSPIVRFTTSDLGNDRLIEGTSAKIEAPYHRALVKNTDAGQEADQ